MSEQMDTRGALASMVVRRVGRLEATEDPLDPYRLVGPDGVVVEAVTTFFRHLLAAGRSSATLRSYGMDLLRWFRFCWATEVDWDRADRTSAREFSILLQVAPKPLRPHWRHDAAGEESAWALKAPGQYSPAVRAHSETVLRSFYDFHRDAGSGPLLNPFPLDRSRRGGRAHAHHNPMEPVRNERVGLYDHGSQPASPEQSPTKSSTRSSPACPRTGTEPSSPSTSLRERGLRNCCRSPVPASIRDVK
jgi:hypothetical protein